MDHCLNINMCWCYQHCPYTKDQEIQEINAERNQ